MPNFGSVKKGDEVGGKPGGRWPSGRLGIVRLIYLSIGPDVVRQDEI